LSEHQSINADVPNGSGYVISGIYSGSCSPVLFLEDISGHRSINTPPNTGTGKIYSFTWNGKDSEGEIIPVGSFIMATIYGCKISDGIIQSAMIRTVPQKNMSDNDIVSGLSLSQYQVPQGTYSINAKYSILQNTSIDIILASDSAVLFRKDYKPGNYGAFKGINEINIPLADLHGNALDPGRYRVCILAKMGTRRRKMELPFQITYIAGVNMASGGGQISYPATTNTHGVGSSALPNSSTKPSDNVDKGNNGVRDHGQGEGRDGHGQGKGNGNEEGKK